MSSFCPSTQRLWSDLDIRVHSLPTLPQFKCCLETTITKTYLYNFDPLKPHFYTVKLGFTGVYIIFLISAQNIDYAEAVLTSAHNLCFEQKYGKFQSFIYEKFQFLEVKFSIYLKRRVFVMA